MFSCQNPCKSVYNGTHPSIYNPREIKPGYTNSSGTSKYNSNTLFTAHPLKLISADEQDKKMKYLRLSKSCGDMYISDQKPNNISCKVVKCPHTYSLSPNNKYLTCWKC